MNSVLLHVDILFSSLKDIGNPIYFLPLFLLFELPYYLIIIYGIIHQWLKSSGTKILPSRFPKVTCIVACYSEGESVGHIISSLRHQTYKGFIEIIAVVDNATKNIDTLDAITAQVSEVNKINNRRLMVVPRKERGGHASSLNIGLKMATGEVIITLDADCSCDNTMTSYVVKDFEDPCVVAVSGGLRVRNVFENFLTRLQGLEYNTSILFSRIGLSHYNAVNTISGAFGAFRKSLLMKMAGWASGSAEDLELTLRIQAYFKRYPKFKVKFNQHAIVHTDVPNTFVKLLKQRIRWDGDLYFLYFRKHKKIFGTKFFSWKMYFFTLLSGIFFQMILPFVIAVYSVGVFAVYPLSMVLAIYVLIYLYYLALFSVIYTLFLLLTSDRPKQDIKLILLLPMLPFYHFFMRIWSAIAILIEIFLHKHRDTTMAPSWVTKRAKF